jgi:uncharacterized protein YpmB
MSTKKGIGYSPLTEKVYLGKQNKEKGMWIGNDKEDITSDFINVMFQYVEPNTTRTIKGLTSKEENIFINVKRDKKSIEKTIRFLEKQIAKI